MVLVVLRGRDPSCWSTKVSSELRQLYRSLHFDFDTENTLAKKNVTNSIVNELVRWLTRVNHETVRELHRFGTGRPKLARNDDLTALGTRLHDETEYTVTSPVSGWDYF